MKKIKIFVFLYNGRDYIPKTVEEYLRQKVSDDISLSLRFILTDTKDGSEEYLKEHHLDYRLVNPKDFNHALTREKAILECDDDIAILLTQDCRVVNTDVYQKLIESIDDEVKFSYVRQINRNRSIERYTRMFNYPKKSRTKSKADIHQLGLNTFFASDACSALDVRYFREIGGYGRPLPTNEDMYYAYKVIQSEKKVRYVAETDVNHSHSFTLKETEKRYYLFGKFLGMLPEFDRYSATHSGLKLALKVIGRILLEFNLKALVLFLPNMLARLRGKKKGYQDGLKERTHNL